MLIFSTQTSHAASNELRKVVDQDKDDDYSKNNHTEDMETPNNHQSHTGLIPYRDEEKGKYGYKDKKGRVIIPAQFSLTHPFYSHGGVANVYMGGHTWYKINKKGDILFQSYFYDNGPDYYHQGLVRIVSEDHRRVGFADKKGYIICKPIYSDILHFGFNAPVTVVYMCHDPNYSYIDYIGPSNDATKKFTFKLGLINRDGKLVLPLVYDKFGYTHEKKQEFSGGQLTLYKKGKAYLVFVNKKDEIVLKEKEKSLTTS